jgi:hypothetical protein
MAFSSELDHSVWSAFPAPPTVPGTQPPALDFFRHELPGGQWTNLTPLVPKPLTFGGSGHGGTAYFDGANDSMSTIGFSFSQKLTSDAAEGVEGAYVWSSADEQLHYIAYRPDGTPIANSPTFIGSSGDGGSGGGGKNTISVDGSQVIFSDNQGGRLYLRRNPTQSQSPVSPGATGRGTLAEGSSEVTSLLSLKATGTLASGFKKVTAVSASIGAFAVGQPVSSSSPGIPPGATITAIGNGTITLSAAATASGSVEITSAGPQPFAAGQTVRGFGIPADTTITAVAPGSLTLSAPATYSGEVALAAGGECTDPADACTIEASASRLPLPETHSTSNFEGASADGSKVLFRSNERLIPAADPGGGLYLFEPASDRLRLLFLDQEPADGITTGAAGVLDFGEEADEVYFAASGRLVPGQPAEPGMNIYAWHDDGSPNGSLAYVTTLSDTGSLLHSNRAIKSQAVQASPNGRYLLFSTHTPLGGYDNAGLPELYRYDSQAAHLQCISCDPTGEPATGYQQPHSLFVGIGGQQDTGYLRRTVLDDGRVVFQTADSLVSNDSNGKIDVYEWEPEGLGSCESHSENGGCLYLISSGTGSEDSFFANTSASGNDIFFFTHDRLVGWDVDGNLDLYDARVAGGLPEPPPPAQSCQGDACQPPPGTHNDPTPASSNFQGAGNLTEPSKPHRRKHHHRKRRAKHNRRTAR